MRLQSNRDYISNDVVQTPIELAQRLVKHFHPCGRVLEPCRGDGNIYNQLKLNRQWCEIREGKDFFDWKEPVDWIFTNPPWSQFNRFLIHSLELASDVMFLVTINHLWTKARMKAILSRDFGICEIALVETPQSFPPMGFQLGAIHLSKYYRGDIKFSDLQKPVPWEQQFMSL